MFGKRKEKKTLNSEVDLVAFISLLSVCICFLLLTSIWIQIGSMNVKQAVGGQAAEGKPKPEMWVVIQEKGELKFELRNVPGKISRTYGRQIPGEEGRPNFGELKTFLSNMLGDYQGVDMALIRPAEKTPFEDIIELMDVFRQQGIEDLGVTPL